MKKKFDTIYGKIDFELHKPQVVRRIKWAAVLLLIINIVSVSLVSYFATKQQSTLAASGDVIILWDTTAYGAVPTGWTCISDNAGEDFYGVFPRAASTYGASTAGSDTHTNHTVTYSSATAGASGTAKGNTGGTSAINQDNHTHTWGTPTLGSGDVRPPYKNLQVIYKNNATTIPANAIVVFDTSTLPSGWTRYSSLDGKYLRGNANNATGGNATHTHTTTQITSGSAAANLTDSGAGANSSNTHNHPIAASSLSNNNNAPQYVEVVFAYNSSGSDKAIPAGAIAMFNTTPPSGWTTVSNSSPWQNSFLKGASSYGGTGGSNNNHNHDGSWAPTSDIPSSSNGNRGTTGTYTGAAQTHTHTVTYNVGTAGSLPVYRDVIFAKKDPYTISVSGNIYTSAANETTLDTTVYSVYISVNNGTPVAATVPGDGTYSKTGVSVSMGDSIAVYIYNNANDANAYTVSGGSNITGLNLIVGKVTIGNNNSESSTTYNSNICVQTSYPTASTPDDRLSSCSTNDITAESGVEWHILQGKAYDTNASATLTTQGAGNLHIDDNSSATFSSTGTIAGSVANDTGGTLVISSANSLSVGGNWTNAGTFAQETSTVTFNGSSVQTITSGGGTFNNVIFNNSSASNPNISYTGALSIGGNISLSNTTKVASTNNTNFSVTGTINSADATDRALTLTSGTADISITGAIGATFDLASLTITGNDITLSSNIGNGSAGVTGATSITSTDAGDTGILTLNGAIYNTNDATYVGGVSGGISITGASAAFTTSADNITFTNTTTLGNITAISVTTSGSAPGSGNISFGSIRGNSDEDISLNASSANTSVGLIGDETANEINTVAITGATNYLNGDIYTSNLANNTVTITGAAAIGANVTINTDEAAADGIISFTSSINSADATDRALTLTSGTADISITGAIGATFDLASLTITGNDITLSSNIGNGSAGVTGATSITSTDAGDTGILTLGGTEYNTNAATYVGGVSGGTSITNSSAVVNFTTSADNFIFTNTVNMIQDFSSFILIRTYGSSPGYGDVTLGTIRGTYGGIRVLASSANISAGIIGDTSDEIGAVLNGATITLSGDITARAQDDVSITGNVLLAANIAIDTSGSSANDGFISINGTINSMDATERTLSLLSDTEALTIGGTIGGVNPLSSLTISGGNTTLADIGTIGSAGVTGATSIAAKAIYGGLTLNGSIYNTGGTQSYNAGSIGQSTYIKQNVVFTTSDDAITFTYTVDSYTGFTNNMTFNTGSGQVTFGSNVGANQSIGLLTKQGSGDLTFGTASLTCTGLTVSGGSINNAGTNSGVWTVNGNLTVTAGIFKNTTNTLNITGNLSLSDGTTFTKAGTIIFKPAGTKTITDSNTTKQDLGVVSISSGSATPKIQLGSGIKVTILSIDTGHTLDLTSSGHTLEIAGDGATATVFTVSGTLTPGTNSTVKYTATNSLGNINLTTTTYNNVEISPATTEIYDMTGNLTSTNAVTGSITIGANATLDAMSGINYNISLAKDWVNNGSFSAQNDTVTFAGAGGSTQIVKGSSNTTFYNFYATASTARTINFASLSTTIVSGTWTIMGAAGQNISLGRDGGSGLDEWYINPTSWSVDYVTPSNSENLAVSIINPTHYSDGGNNTKWFPAGITISGTVFTNEGKTTNIGVNKTVHLFVNSTDKSTDETDANGVYQFAGVSGVAANDSVIVYLDDETENGSTVTLAVDGTTNITTLDIITDHISLEHRTAGPITNTDLDDIDGVDATNEDGITISSGNAEFADNFELYILTGMIYTPGGTVTCDSFEAVGTATFSPGANNVTVSNNWAFSATGTFTTSGTVTFDATTTGHTLTGGLTGSQAFYQVTFNGTGGAWTIEDPMTTIATTTASFVIGNGTVTLGNGANDNLEVRGTMSIANTANQTGTFQTYDSLAQTDGTITIDINQNNAGSPPACVNCKITVGATSGTGQGNFKLKKNAVLRLNPGNVTGQESDTFIETETTGYLEIQGSLDDSGTTNGTVNETTLTDTTKNWSTDAHNGKHVRITSGYALGKVYEITDTTTTTLIRAATASVESTMVAISGSDPIRKICSNNTDLITANKGEVSRFLHDKTGTTAYFRIIDSVNDDVTCTGSKDSFTINADPGSFAALAANDTFDISDGIFQGDTYEILDYANVTADKGLTCNGNYSLGVPRVYIYGKAGSEIKIEYGYMCNLGADAALGGYIYTAANGANSNEGLTINKSYFYSNGYYIKLNGPNNNDQNSKGVTNSYFKNNAREFNLDSSGGNNLISGNTMIGTGWPIRINSSRNVIKNNRILGHSLGALYTNMGANNSIISGNEIAGGTGAFLSGPVYISNGSQQYLFSQNNVYGNYGYIWIRSGGSIVSNYFDTMDYVSLTSDGEPFYLINNHFGTKGKNTTADIKADDGTTAHNIFMYNNELFSDTEIHATISLSNQYLISRKHDGVAGATKIWGEYTIPDANAETPQVEETNKFNYGSNLWEKSATPHLYSGAGTEDTNIAYDLTSATLSSGPYSYRVVANTAGQGASCGTSQAVFDVYRNGTDTGLDATSGTQFTDTNGSVNTKFTIECGATPYSVGDTYTFTVWDADNSANVNAKTVSMMQDGDFLAVPSGKTLEMKGQSAGTNETTVTRGATGGYHFAVAGTIDAQYYKFSYLGGTGGGLGLDLQSTATVTNIANGTYDNYQNVGTTDTYIRVHSNLIGTGSPTKTFASLTFLEASDAVPEYTVTESGGTAPGDGYYWLFDTTATCTGWTDCESSDSEQNTSGTPPMIGSIRWTPNNIPPNSPSSLVQKKTSDTVISQGGWTNETSVKYTATASDPDSSDTLYLCIEKDPIGTAFSGTEDSCGTGVAYSGAPVAVTHTITSQTDNTEYHWQARIKDDFGAYSSWVSYGTNNDPNDTDYGIDTSAPSGGTVKDGQTSGGDLDWNTDGSLTSLLANWTGTEPDSSASGLAKYEYALRRQPDNYYWTPGTPGSWGASEYWYDNGTNNSFTVNSLNLSTGVTYYVSLKTTDNATNTATINSNGIQVTPTLSFEISSNSVTFSDLNNGNNWTDTKQTTFTTSTNASGGYSINVIESDYLRSLVYVTEYIADFGGTWTTPENWANFCKDDAADCGFGYTSSDTTIGPSRTNKFSSGTLFAKYEQSFSGSTLVADHVDAVNGSTGAIVNEQFTLTHKVSTPMVQTASPYQTTLTVICTANY